MIGSGNKCTLIIFIISNSKLGIWICNQPIIDINPKSNLYDVLTLDHTILFPAQSTNYILGTHYTIISYRRWRPSPSMILESFLVSICLPYPLPRTFARAPTPSLKTGKSFSLVALISLPPTGTPWASFIVWSYLLPPQRLNGPRDAAPFPPSPVSV